MVGTRCKLKHKTQFIFLKLIRYAQQVLGLFTLRCYLEMRTVDAISNSLKQWNHAFLEFDHVGCLQDLFNLTQKHYLFLAICYWPVSE
jgi:hypothetical protein